MSTETRLWFMLLGLLAGPPMVLIVATSWLI